MATIASATNNAATVIVKESGARGANGTDGADGSGFNEVRKSLIDNPVVSLYKRNKLATVLNSTISVNRDSPAHYKDIHNLIILEDPNFPREEASGWLIEPAGTNLILESETFGTTWSLSNLTIAENDTLAPNDILSADKLIEDGANTVKDISQAVTVANITPHSLSVHAKQNGVDWIYLQDTANSNAGAYFNITTGVIGVTDAGITASIELVKNSFYRCVIYSTSTSTSGGMKIQLADSDGGGAYTGDSTSGVYLWGAQLESSKHETSYITTITTSLNRVFESHSIKTLNNIPFIDDGFSFLIRLIYRENTTTQNLVTIPDLAGGNLFELSTNAGKWEATIKGSDTFDYSALSILDADSTTHQTLIVTVAGGVINLYVDSALAATDTIATGLTGLVDVDNTTGLMSIASGTDFKANISDLRVFDFALNTSEIDYLS